MEYVFSNNNSKSKAKMASSSESGATVTKVHLLPFKIERDGSARVGAYFDSITEKINGKTSEQPDYVRASLYGRDVSGLKAELPENISAHVFSRNATNFERVKFTETTNECELYQWQHDEVPSISNHLQANLVYNSIMANLASE